MDDVLKTDLSLVFFPKDAIHDEVDLDVGMDDLEIVSGLGNLVQALRLRLLIDKGELAGLGHPRYGSRIREIIGEPHTHANLELLRRYVRQTLLQDPRVEDVTHVVITPDTDGEGVVAKFKVIAVTGGEVEVKVDLYGN